MHNAVVFFICYKNVCFLNDGQMLASADSSFFLYLTWCQEAKKMQGNIISTNDRTAG